MDRTTVRGGGFLDSIHKLNFIRSSANIVKTPFLLAILIPTAQLGACVPIFVHDLYCRELVGLGLANYGSVTFLRGTSKSVIDLTIFSTGIAISS